MRLKNYLLEDGRSQSINKEKALKMLSSSSYKFSLKGTPMYRGLPSYKGDFLIVSPANFERVSRNTDNYYTLLMDNLPQWREYPKRSKSIICSTSYEIAQEYSGEENSLYVVIPKVGSKIGVCSDADIWNSFAAFDSLISFNNIINHLLKLADKYITYIDDIYDLRDLFMHYDDVVNELHGMYEELEPEELNNTNISDFILNYMEDYLLFSREIYKSSCEYETLSKLCKHYSKGGKTLDFFAELLDPDENGFELEIAGNHKLPYNREVWTDGTSILIESEVFDNLEE